MAFLRLKNFYKVILEPVDFYARRRFVYDGKEFLPGQKFEFSVPKNKLKALYDSARIEARLKRGGNIKSSKQEAEKQTTSKTASVEIKESSGPSKWYSVFVDGEKIGKSFRDKKDAEKLASQYV